MIETFATYKLNLSITVLQFIWLKLPQIIHKLMATLEQCQPPAGQPIFLPRAPGAAAPLFGAMAAPGSEHVTPYYRYDPQMASGAIGVIMPVIATQPRSPKYEYTPNDYMVLSLITVILCGIFSPLSLMLSFPALLFSKQSKKNALIGAVKDARKQGVIAAYLNVAAIIAALVIDCLVVGLVFGLYGPVYAREQYCSQSGYCGY